MFYLDHNATSPIRPEVVQVMMEEMQRPVGSNPSSVHAAGRAARAKLEVARRVLAQALSCHPTEVIFTASGTEANQLALRGQEAVRSWVICATEHPSVLGVPTTLPREILPVDDSGLVRMGALAELLQRLPSPALVAVMLAHNETGVIQPIAEVAALVHRYGGVLHVDAVQALGKMRVDVGLLMADTLSVCAHKMGGAPGAAALVARQGIIITPQMWGGAQESRRRAGTENLPALLGFAKAVELAQQDAWLARIIPAMQQLERELEAAGGVILGKDTPRLGHVCAVLMPGVEAQVQLMRFDLEGVCVSAGSACASGRMEYSAVAQAMGFEAARGGVIRISAGWNTTAQEVQHAAQVWKKIAHSTKK